MVYLLRVDMAAIGVFWVYGITIENSWQDIRSADQSKRGT